MLKGIPNHPLTHVESPKIERKIKKTLIDISSPKIPQQIAIKYSKKTLRSFISVCSVNIFPPEDLKQLNQLF
jgi:hypothetical protein